MQFLDISFNNIKELPGQLGSLPQLERLNAGFNPLGPELPLCICLLKELRELNLDFANIESIPVEFGELKLLEGIQLEGNPLQHPFDGIYKKSPFLLVQFHDQGTEVLDLSGCNMEEIPDDISRLKKLHTLNLSNNAITTVPLGVGLLNSLVNFTLENNPLKGPFKDIRREPYGDMAIVAFLDTYVTNLDLSGCSFAAVPDLLSRHADNLETLNLSDNLLLGLPDYISMFQGLSSLVLDNNCLKEFPQEICLLKNLEELSISKTEIKCIPPEIVDMKGLKRFTMDSNDISELPKEFVLLTNLNCLPSLEVRWKKYRRCINY